MNKTLTILIALLMLFSFSALNSMAEISFQDRPDTTKTKKAAAKGKNTTSIKKDTTKPGTITYPKPLTGIEKEMAERNDKAAHFYGEGLKSLQANDANGAIENFTKSIENYKTPVALLRRGMTYIIVKKYPDAIADLNEALKMDTTSATGYFGLGLAFFEMNQIDNAEFNFTKFIARDSSNIQAYNYLAAINFMKKNYTAAIHYYDRVIKMNPKFPDAYVNRGMMRHNLNDIEGAIKDYNEEINIKPQSPKAYNNRGAAYLALQNYEDALKDFTKAIELKNNYAEAYENRGKVKVKLGDTNGACSDWQEGLKLGMTTCTDLISKYCK
ncbi:MAG: tetratricopeptide repeat protein [Syntrophothermus sp.]